MQKTFTKEYTSPGGRHVKESFTLTANGPFVDMLNKSVGPTAGFPILFAMLVIIFALALYLLVAACMFVKPLFVRPKKDPKTGRYHLRISSHLAKILKASCIVFWILLVLLMIDISYGETKRQSTPTSIRISSIVYFAFVVVVAVGVGFLTHKLWKDPSADGSVTLNLFKTQLVFIKIAIVSEIITFPLVVLMMFSFLMFIGISMGRMTYNMGRTAYLHNL